MTGVTELMAAKLLRRYAIDRTGYDGTIEWTQALMAGAKALEEIQLLRKIAEVARIEQQQHTCGQPEYHTPGICDLCAAFAPMTKFRRDR